MLFRSFKFNELEECIRAIQLPDIAPNCEELKSVHKTFEANPEAEINNRISFDGADVKRLIAPVINCSKKLIETVDKWITYKLSMKPKKSFR